MIQLAIIGPTASGKSDLAIEIAIRLNAYILSIDSLSIYKEVDIASAKPSKDDLLKVKHFGIDELYIDKYFSVEVFIKLYKDVVDKCKKDGKNLIIVGGSTFYLKSLLDGLSKIPTITKQIEDEARKFNNQQSYNILKKVDAKFMNNISPNDTYRIQKAMLIYLASKLPPGEWFRLNPPQSIIKNLSIYNILIDRQTLRQRVQKRTIKMHKDGLLDEVFYLEKRYTREPNAMKSIGIVEALSYFDAKISLQNMLELIATHTMQLAKRQQTFNNSAFSNSINAPLDILRETISNAHILGKL